MNDAMRTRRLASPVRLALAMNLGADLDGAWWPRSSSVALELPELAEALSPRLGEIRAITVNWSPAAATTNLDTPNYPRNPDPTPKVRHQRLMMITGSTASANLLVVPCHTSAALAVMVLRQAGARNIALAERETPSFRSADVIVRAARTAHALFRLQQSGAEPDGDAVN